MPDSNKVIKGLDVCFNLLQAKCSECPYNDIELVSECTQSLGNDTINLLKEQEELIKAMKMDLDLVRSCKVCGNWTECTPDAPPESEEFKMWRDCGGSCKLNWIWRGV